MVEMNIYMVRGTKLFAGLQVWGTLKVLLEIKAQGFISKVEPYVNRFQDHGGICQRF